MGLFYYVIIQLMFWLLVWGIFGTIAGSFVVATMWRIRASQLRMEKKYRDSDYQKLVKKNQLDQCPPKQDYSRCLHCGFRLRWFDLIPVVSWLLLRGRCRQCHRPIGVVEVLAEIGLGLIFGLSLWLWPFQDVNWLGACLFGIWTAWLISAAILFLYDLKWLELPNQILYINICLALLFSLIRIFQAGFCVGVLLDHVLSVALLAGIYWFLSFVSKEAWVGSGDSYIGLSISLILGSGLLALVVLFLANLLGTIVVVPGLVSKKINKTDHLPLGPLLILAAVIVFLGQSNILVWLDIF